MLSVHYNSATNYASHTMRLNTRAQQGVMEKLASGYKINKAADGPSDLVQSEKLRAQIEGLERALRGASESDHILDIMDGALGEVQSLLKKMKNLAIESANTGVISQDRLAANQSEMDCALQAIERILDTTTYGGQKIIDGLAQTGVIGDNYEAIINAGKLGETYGGKLRSMLSPGESGDGTLSFVDPDYEALPQFDENGLLINGDTTFIINGLDDPDNPITITFAEGTSLIDIVAALREQGDNLSDHIKDTPPTTLFNTRRGDDINQVEMDPGSLAALVGMSDEDAASYVSEYMESFSRELNVDLDGWNRLSDYQKQLLIVADDMRNLSMDTFGKTAVQTGTDENGNAIFSYLSLKDIYSGGAADLTTDAVAAMSIINQADKSVAAQRAAIGATRAMNMHLRAADEAHLENLTRIESYIRDTDYAEATTEFARTQILAQTGMLVLKQAQQQNQMILDLLA